MPRRTTDPEGEKIADLIAEERSNIDTIKSNLGQELLSTDIATELDDLYILRFLLSSKTVESAEVLVRQNISWRNKHVDILKRISKGGEAPKHDVISRFMTVGFCGSTTNGNPIFCVRAAYSDPKSLMNTMDLESVALFMHFNGEKSYSRIDRYTRESGILTKAIFVLDLCNFSILKGNDSRYRNALGMGSKLNEANYPQLLGKHVFINAPKMFSIMYQAVKLVMPKSSLVHHGFCPAQNSASGDASKCPFVQKVGALGVLPKFLGGKAECPEDLLEPHQKAANKSLVPETISAGSTKTLDPIVVTKSDSIILVEVLVSSNSVSMRAEFMPDENNKPPILFHEGGGKSQKISAADGLYQTSWVAPSPGTLTVCFENSSRFRSKKMEHGFVVCDPIVQSGLETPGGEEEDELQASVQKLEKELHVTEEDSVQDDDLETSAQELEQKPNFSDMDSGKEGGNDVGVVDVSVSSDIQ